METNQHFLLPVRQGDFLVARGIVDHATRSMVFMSGALQVEERVVMTTKAIFKIVRPGGQAD